MLVDTHSHIYSKEFNGELADAIKRAVDNGVERILLPNIDSSSIRLMLDLADQYPQICFPMIGIHPTSINEDFEEELELVEYWLGKRTFYGIGEIGIDLYWDKTFVDEQVVAFKCQLELAKMHQLPLSIHTRESFEMVYDILKNSQFPGMKGVFHAFTGTVEQAQQVIDLGFKLGVGGIVTFKNSGIDQVISQIDLSHLILESDAPYLAPTPLRGKRNESAYIIYTAQKLSEIYGVSVDEIARQTTQNACNLFGI
jgi:TatD DNase family protein